RTGFRQNGGGSGEFGEGCWRLPALPSGRQLGLRTKLTTYMAERGGGVKSSISASPLPRPDPAPAVHRQQQEKHGNSDEGCMPHHVAPFSTGNRQCYQRAGDERPEKGRDRYQPRSVPPC